ALWSQPGHERMVAWTTATDGCQRFTFRGGLILISNRPLADLPVGNGLGGYHYFGVKGARPKQPGFGEVAPTLGRTGFFSRIRLTRGGLGPKMITVDRSALLRSRR